MIARPTDFTNFTQYTAQLQIWSNQQNQDTINQTAHDDYVEQAQSWVQTATSEVAHGQTIPPVPVMPLKKTFNDDGTVTLTPFPDLGVPSLPIPGSSSGTIANPTAPAPMTQMDVVLMLLNEIAKKLGL